MLEQVQLALLSDKLCIAEDKYKESYARPGDKGFTREAEFSQSTTLACFWRSLM